MPLPKNYHVKFSKEITLPSGHKTLGLFGTIGNSKQIKMIDVRVGVKRKNGHYHCPSKKTHPQERARIAKRIGVKV